MADHQGLDAFFALLIFAFAGSIVLLDRCVVSYASYSILFFFGYKSVREPPFGLCVTQAALGYAAPVLMAGTTLPLVVTVRPFPLFSNKIAISIKCQAFYNVKARISGTAVIRQTSATALMGRQIIGFPYILHGTMFIACLIIGLANPTTVRRDDGFYCTFIVREPARTTAGIVIVLVVIAICFLGGKTFRPVVFFWACLVFVTITSKILDSDDQNLNVVLACLHIAVVMIFGIAKDIGRAWMFWRTWQPELIPASDDEDKPLTKAETTQVV
ncbi:hypothetical protein BKA70DRAFT_1422568 [Coprinopsis sp. MPI-PUGE-AT-0042]|nr:hypothetical protein BKA70DRAFT_1422568 [Coprinopsis sp. MPI-PUGE-AT-0042]